MRPPRERFADDSGTRIFSRLLERFGPQTQRELCERAGMTKSAASKCLAFLEHEGYVCRLHKTWNRTGSRTGAQPWLYARTVKPLPDLPGQQPAPPTSEELRNIMNSMIRSNGLRKHC
jgi:hypothetical protein